MHLRRLRASIVQKRYQLIVLCAIMLFMGRVYFELIMDKDSGYVSIPDADRDLGENVAAHAPMREWTTTAKRVHLKTFKISKAQAHVPNGIGSEREKDFGPDICDKCSEINAKLLASPKGLCESGPIKLVIFVTSGPNDTRARVAIRQSWASITKLNTGIVRYFFLLGKGPTDKILSSHLLREEMKLYNDIVMYDMLDVYQNLTMKSILGLRYFVENCPTANYVMKTDTDVYVNVPAILSLISDPNYTNNAWDVSKLNDILNESKRFLKNTNSSDTTSHPMEMFGLKYHEAKPIRNGTGHQKKWIVNYTDYADAIYPDYFDGHGYILSSKVAKDVVHIQKEVPLFRFEDVYLGLCLKKLGYHIRHTNGFIRSDHPLTTCSHKYSHTYTVHGIDPEKMRSIWHSECINVTRIEYEHARKVKRWIKLEVIKLPNGDTKLITYNN